MSDNSLGHPQSKVLRRLISSIHKEIHYENIIVSSSLFLDQVVNLHNGIIDFFEVAHLFFPLKEDTPEWERRLAFVLYHWEAFNAAFQSLTKALCSYYNIAFTLLRTAFELIMKGALFEGLAHAEKRNSASELRKSSAGKRILELLNRRIESDDRLQESLERKSAVIFDVLGDDIYKREFYISMPQIIAQLSSWNWLETIEDPLSELYTDIYCQLSKDVHIIPDRTDIGKRVFSGKGGIFDNKVMEGSLKEYLSTAERVIDSLIVVELNVFRNLIRNRPQITDSLAKHRTKLLNRGFRKSMKCIDCICERER